MSRRKTAMRKWRNWQTRTFEGRVVYTVRVQVPFSAPNKTDLNNVQVCFVLCDKATNAPECVSIQGFR